MAPRAWLPRGRWTRRLIAIVAVPVFVAAGLAGYYYGRFSVLIDQRLAGERVRAIPRLYGRPLAFRPGLTLAIPDVVQRLNDLGYTGRDAAREPGEFALADHAVVIVSRGGAVAGRRVRLEWAVPPAPAKGAKPRPAPPPSIAKVLVADQPVNDVSLDPPLLSALANPTRERRRRVPLAAIPAHVQQAVLAIEDRRFYSHPGIDPIRMVGALVTNLRGSRSYLVGASTITQQLARNFFLTEEMAVEQQSGRRSLRRKLLEQFMAVVLETKATKEEILELYLNEVY
ncbi:MAG: transglycosylase domain-containing protein, partial [Acidobacteriota bacterium]